MKKQFAYLLMNPNANPKTHRFSYQTDGVETSIFTVNSIQQAHELVLDLQKKGFGAIELCGAFGRDAAKQLINATGGTLAIGYVVNEPEQDALFATFFQGDSSFNK